VSTRPTLTRGPANTNLISLSYRHVGPSGQPHLSLSSLLSSSWRAVGTSERCAAHTQGRRLHRAGACRCAPRGLGCGRRESLLTPKFGTGRSLICGPNSVKKSIRKKEGLFRKIRQRSSQSAVYFRSAGGLFALILRDCVMTWPERKGRMDG
jgi:hypothetical protein